MILFSIIAVIAFYLLTRRDSLRFRQVVWPIYSVLAIIYWIGMLILQPETTTYVFWSQLFFILLILPIFTLVIREIWQLNRNNPTWLKYTVTIPVSLLFVLTLWACWNIFPVFMYIF